jgi:hypothetical protein
MKKTFIKVTGTYACKNKLQKSIFENMKELDGTLCGNQGTAFKLIELAFNDPVNNYNGTAKKPELKRFEPNDTTVSFIVEEVITMSVYDVVNDLTIKKN